MPPTQAIATRRQFSHAERRRAYEHWLSIDKNTKGTARDLDINSATVQGWTRQWHRGENIPAELDPEDMALQLGTAEGDVSIVGDLREIRKRALKRMYAVVDKTTNLDQLGRVVEQFSNRIDRAEGHGVPDTVNVNFKLPNVNAADFAKQLVAGAISDADQRSEEIHDAEIESPRQLSPVSLES